MFVFHPDHPVNPVNFFFASSKNPEKIPSGLLSQGTDLFNSIISQFGDICFGQGLCSVPKVQFNEAGSPVFQLAGLQQLAFEIMKGYHQLMRYINLLPGIIEHFFLRPPLQPFFHIGGGMSLRFNFNYLTATT